MMNIANSTVILTGATGGIGQAIARALAERGARLILIGRQQATLEQLRQTLSDHHKHDLLVADIRRHEGLETISGYATANPSVDVLINCAGCNTFAHLARRDPAQIEDEIRINLVAPILMCQMALEWLNRPGIILNIGSTFGAIGYPGYTTYCASKAGLHRFTESLDRELSGTGMRALYLAPRATDTALNPASVQEMNRQLGNRTDPPEIVATHVIRMLENETRVKWIGWPEKLFVRINQLIPGLVTSSLVKKKATIDQFAAQEDRNEPA
jgi:short-subunit dehydrogenase